MRITELVEELRAEGIEVGGLAELDQELGGLERPDLWERAKQFASLQWSHAQGEFHESTEMLALMMRTVEGDALDAEQRARMEEQLEDVVRALPAVSLTLTLKAIPGGALVTPWVLRKLGLLPSLWREAHLLERLRQEAQKMRAEHPVAAQRVDVLRATLTQEGERRAVLQADLQAHWDLDRDGMWDPEETEAYEKAVAHAVTQDPWRRNWYLMSEDTVFGPTRLAELPEDLPAVLVSWGGAAWLRREDLDFAEE